MANIRISARDYYWIEWEIYDLQYYAGLYDEFEVDVYNNDNGKFIETVSWTTSVAYYYTQQRSHNLACYVNYRGEGWAKWDGTWYSVGSVTGRTPMAPAPSWTIYESLSSSEVELAWGHIPGAKGYYLMIRKYGDTSWDTYFTEGYHVIVSGLQVSTTYEFRVQAWFEDASGYEMVGPLSSIRSVTTDDPGVDAPLWWGEYTRVLSPSAIEVTWYPGDCYDWEIQIRVAGTSEWQSFITDGHYGGTFNNLQPNTTYEFRVRGYGNGGWSDWSSVISLTTFRIMPPLWNSSNCYVVSPTTINLGWYSVDYADGYEVRVETIEGLLGYVIVDEPGKTTVRIGGLQPDTIYYFLVRGYHLAANGSAKVGEYGTTINLKTLLGTPGEFDWDIPKVSGGEFNLISSEWNDFTSAINERRDYKGLGSYAFIGAYSGSDFRANMFNQANTAIGDMISTGISSRSAGDIVYASFLNTLRDKLNSIT